MQIHLHRLHVVLRVEGFCFQSAKLRLNVLLYEWRLKLHHLICIYYRKATSSFKSRGIYCIYSWLIDET